MVICQLRPSAEDRSPGVRLDSTALTQIALGSAGLIQASASTQQTPGSRQRCKGGGVPSEGISQSQLHPDPARDTLKEKDTPFKRDCDSAPSAGES